CMPTEFRGAERSPRDAVARAVEAAKRSGKPGDARQSPFFRTEYVIHHDLSRDRGAQAELALDLGRRESLHAFLEHKAIDASVVGLGPHDEYAGDWRVGNPHSGACEPVAPSDGFGARA